VKHLFLLLVFSAWLRPDLRDGLAPSTAASRYQKEGGVEPSDRIRHQRRSNLFIPQGECGSASSACCTTARLSFVFPPLPRKVADIMRGYIEGINPHPQLQMCSRQSISVNQSLVSQQTPVAFDLPRRRELKRDHGALRQVQDTSQSFPPFCFKRAPNLPHVGRLGALMSIYYDPFRYLWRKKCC
jgi:hypothetical protein